MIGALGIESGCDERQRARCKFELGEFFEWTCRECEKNTGGRR